MSSLRLRFLAVPLICATALTSCSKPQPSNPSSSAPAQTSVAAAGSSSPGDNQTSAPPAQTSVAPAGNGSQDGSWVGTVYFPGHPANQGEKLTFTVVNGAVNNWLGYISGECNPTLESVYIQGPAPIVSGVVAKGEKTTPEADKPGYYTSSSIVGTFVGNSASGTANYVAVGPCVEPQWDWSATRISS